jgi:hypothetical protein
MRPHFENTRSLATEDAAQDTGLNKPWLQQQAMDTFSTPG